jgi:cytoskeletal protein RodZ
MGYEISQFDIQDRQLMASDLQPKTAKASDIGEAKVTRTFFGRARVRVIRAQDRKRRTWLLAALLVMAAAAAAWQGWVIVQRVENEPPPVPLSERISVSPPVFRPAHIAPDPHPSNRRPESLIQSEIDSMLSGPLPRHPPPELKALVKTAEKPAQPATDNSAPATAVNSAEVNDSDQQQPGTQLLDTPPVAMPPSAKIVAATPKPASNQTARLAEPSDSGDAVAPSPTASGAPAKAQ